MHTRRNWPTMLERPGSSKDVNFFPSPHLPIIGGSLQHRGSVFEARWLVLSTGGNYSTVDMKLQWGNRSFQPLTDVRTDVPWRWVSERKRFCHKGRGDVHLGVFAVLRALASLLHQRVRTFLAELVADNAPNSR
jgi:hypothetical protein